jgi:uncharacterized membrane protein (DUF373 family)
VQASTDFFAGKLVGIFWQGRLCINAGKFNITVYPYNLYSYYQQHLVQDLYKMVDTLLLLLILF